MARCVPAQLLKHLRSGGSIVYPTSSLPGLGCLPNSAALDRLFGLKQRSAAKEVSLGVASLDQAAQLVRVPDEVPGLLGSFPRGSLTLVLPAITPLDPRLGGEAVAVRVFANAEARLLAEAVGPVTATSANLAGVPPELDCSAAARALGLPSNLVMAGACGGGVPSTILRWNGAFRCFPPIAPTLCRSRTAAADDDGGADCVPEAAGLAAAPRWSLVREGMVAATELQGWLI
jgi:tRNA threonylcarbamoyl adenosine modification protein (Sua5/YciO/YrdC/YwlC family)